MSGPYREPAPPPSPPKRTVLEWLLEAYEANKPRKPQLRHCPGCPQAPVGGCVFECVRRERDVRGDP